MLSWKALRKKVRSILIHQWSMKKPWHSWERMNLVKLLTMSLPNFFWSSLKIRSCVFRKGLRNKNIKDPWKPMPNISKMNIILSSNLSRKKHVTNKSEHKTLFWFSLKYYIFNYNNEKHWKLNFNKKHHLLYL